ncbi:MULTISPECIES: hypothetical protein [unclassified Rathayibacter]|uniref:hypothetical protein n=1 Tax=unclassified Rathayibacter TaxID=2609250 RepID=UPI00188BA6AF|nr:MULTISPECIES: hypothetical protein [unclassified Rathayibacter]MBF4463326.1 hypothetical protein [Rathayibacter sp. VKM Ac-2879]MBF4504437.1 hypothetical protein [Rathayibacter sp. VKM Ac-2878]
MTAETPEEARARRRRALLWVVPLLMLLIGGLVALTLAIGGFALRSMTASEGPHADVTLARTTPSTSSLSAASCAACA